MSAPVALAHDGTEIPFLVAGSGGPFLFLGFGAMADTPEARQPWIDGLGDHYRLIFMTYPGEPKMYTLTPAAVVRDILAVADAAGAERFAWYGYSWGAVCALQLALRTDRLTAMVAGGFPMVGGPYAEMLRFCKTLEAGPVTAFGVQVPHLPENARQFVTFYEGLRTFDDRAAQSRLRCPRLTFAGTADTVVANDEVIARIGQTVVDRREELERFGWEVKLLEGLNHMEGAAPAVVIPVLQEWLAATLGPDDR